MNHISQVYRERRQSNTEKNSTDSEEILTGIWKSVAIRGGVELMHKVDNLWAFWDIFLTLNIDI